MKWLKSQKKNLLWIIPGLFVAAWSIWIFGTSRQFGDCVHTRKQYEAYQAFYEEPFFVIKLLLRVKLNSVCAVHAADAYNGAIAALAGIAVATFTLALWKSTDKLWVAGEAQFKLSLRALNHTINTDLATQRAYVARVNLSIRVNVTDDGKSVKKVQSFPVWLNQGRTPARNVKFCSYTPIIVKAGDDIPTDFEPNLIPVENQSFASIGSGQAMEGGQSDVDPADLIPLSKRETRIFIITRIEYNDIFQETELRVSQHCEEMIFAGLGVLTKADIQPSRFNQGMTIPFTFYGHSRFQVFT